VIANPKDIAVEVLSGAELEDKTVSIVALVTTLTDLKDPKSIKSIDEFALSLDGQYVAASRSARALSRWALGPPQRARFVRFDFDLRWER